MNQPSALHLRVPIPPLNPVDPCSTRMAFQDNSLTWFEIVFRGAVKLGA